MFHKHRYTESNEKLPHLLEIVPDSAIQNSSYIVAFFEKECKHLFKT